MRVLGSAADKATRVRGLVTFVCSAALASSCIVYTPDLLDDGAVSLGDGSKSAASPAAAVPSASTARLPSVASLDPEPDLQNERGARLEQSKLAPELLGATIDEPTTEWIVDAGAAPDAAPDGN